MKIRVALFLTIALCFTSCSGGTVPSKEQRNEAAGNASPGPPQALSPAGEQELRAILANGRLADLQWPNFSEDSAAVREFYDEAGYRLGWIRDGRPTAQAVELIGL